MKNMFENIWNSKNSINGLIFIYTYQLIKYKIFVQFFKPIYKKYERIE